MVQTKPTPISSGGQDIEYLMWVSGSTYYAQNGTTGVTTSNATFATLFHAVLDAMTGGGKIMFKAGTYAVSTPLIIDVAYISIEGAGWGTLFSLANGVDGNVFRVTANNCFMRNLRIFGNNANNAGTSHGIYVYRCAGHRFENLKIYNMESDGIHVGEASGVWATIECLGGKITDCYIGDGTDVSTGNGIYLDYAATDWEVDKNILAKHTTATKAGLVIDGSNNRTSGNHMWGNYYNAFIAPANHVAGWVSIGDKFNDNMRHGIYKPTGKWWMNSNLTGCYFWRNGEDTADTYDSIYTVGDVRCIAVSGCSGRGENDATVHKTKFFWNADADVDYCSVTGCIFEGYNEAAPLVFAGTDCESAHNIVYDCS